MTRRKLFQSLFLAAGAVVLPVNAEAKPQPQSNVITLKLDTSEFSRILRGHSAAIKSAVYKVRKMAR